MNSQAQPISSKSTFWLSKEDINKFVTLAKSGDKDAAFKLTQYYLFSEYDEEKIKFWTEKAAELNHPIAQYNLAYIFYMQVPPNYEKSIFWAQKSMENKNPSAENLIEEVKEKMRGLHK